MTLAKDTLAALLWSPINSIPSVCSRKHAGIAESRSASNCCNVHCLHPARDLIGAYVLPWHSHRAAFALGEQVNDWQEDSGYPAYKPQVLCSSHRTLGSPKAGPGALGGHIHHPQHSAG